MCQDVVMWWINRFFKTKYLSSSNFSLHATEVKLRDGERKFYFYFFYISSQTIPSQMSAKESAPKRYLHKNFKNKEGKKGIYICGKYVSLFQTETRFEELRPSHFGGWRGVHAQRKEQNTKIKEGGAFKGPHSNSDLQTSTRTVQREERPAKQLLFVVI